MRVRQAPPRLWLMTDERADGALEAALRRLPRGSGVLFRHHRTPAKSRMRRYRFVRQMARRRGLLLLLAGPVESARRWRADGVHGRVRRLGAAPGLLRTAPVHTMRELRQARGADLVFLSPVFATRSHPGAATLGRLRFAALARWSPVPVVALGGMTARRAVAFGKLGAWGWAAIDAWT